MLLPALFHWAPTERRVSILQNGLVPYSPPVTHSAGAFPYVCLSPTPSSAWGLSGDMEWTSEVAQWDLWQVRLQDSDEVHVLPGWGPVLREIRVQNALSADRVWYVATREPLTMRETDD